MKNIIGRRGKFTDDDILDKARELKASNKPYGAFAVRKALGGVGRLDRIERILTENEVLVIDADPIDQNQELYSLPPRFQEQVEHMQTALLSTASQMYTEACLNADNRVKTEYEEAKKAKIRAESEVTEAVDSINHMEEEMEVIENELEETKACLKKAEREIELLTSANEKMKASVDDSLGTIRSLKEEIGSLKKKNDDLNQSMIRADHTNELNQANIERLEIELAAERAELTNIAGDSKVKDEKITTLNEKVSDVRRQLTKEENAHKKSVDSMNERLIRFEKVFEKIDIPAHKLEATLSGLRDDNEVLTESLASVSADLEDASSEIESLRSRLETEQKKAKK